jgi:hypothetical protein
VFEGILLLVKQTLGIVGSVGAIARQKFGGRNVGGTVPVGSNVGNRVGATVGASVGNSVGATVGEAVPFGDISTKQIFQPLDVTNPSLRQDTLTCVPGANSMVPGPSKPLNCSLFTVKKSKPLSVLK